MDNGSGEEWNIVDTDARAPVSDGVYNAGRDCSAASTHTAIATRHKDLRYAVGAVKPCRRVHCTRDGNPGDIIPPGATRDTAPRTQKQGNSF